MKSPRMARGTHVETVLFVTSDMFSTDDGYIGVSDVRLEQNFAVKRTKNATELDER